MSELIRGDIGMQGDVNFLWVAGIVIVALILNWISKSGGPDE